MPAVLVVARGMAASDPVPADPAEVAELGLDRLRRHVPGRDAHGLGHALVTQGLPELPDGLQLRRVQAFAGKGAPEAFRCVLRPAERGEGLAPFVEAHPEGRPQVQTLQADMATPVERSEGRAPAADAEGETGVEQMLAERGQGGLGQGCPDCSGGRADRRCGYERHEVRARDWAAAAVRGRGAERQG